MKTFKQEGLHYPIGDIEIDGIVYHDCVVTSRSITYDETVMSMEEVPAYEVATIVEETAPRKTTVFLDNLFRCLSGGRTKP